MYYKDLTPYQHYKPLTISNVLHVGWLDKAHEFEKSSPAPGLVEKIHRILLHKGNLNCRVNAKRGIHPCHLCGTREFERSSIGFCELWIPSSIIGQYFATPSTIIHYIQGHQYRPPQVFVDSVMELSLDMCFVGQNLRSELLGIPKHLWYSPP